MVIRLIRFASVVKDATSLFVGSMILAQAMQYVQLHRRLALFVLNFVGSTIQWFANID